MNSKVGHSKAAGSKTAIPAGDFAKYALAIALAAAGVFAFYWFTNQWPVAVRGLAVAAGLVLGALVFLTTAKGREVREFLGESRFELRKVVWPSRQEAMRTTWVVIVVVIAVSLILAGFDFVIQIIVKWLLGR
jgi:preprotein translocase subunit SecE